MVYHFKFDFNLNELQLNAFDNGDFWNYGFANQIMEVSGIFFLTLMLCQ